MTRPAPLGWVLCNRGPLWGAPREDGVPCLRWSDDTDLRIRFLKGLVWFYVIESQELATQRHGQRRIIRDLFNFYIEAIRGHDSDPEVLIPRRFGAQLEDVRDRALTVTPSAEEPQLAADIVASFTAHEAAQMHYRLTGVARGSVTEVIEV